MIKAKPFIAGLKKGIHNFSQTIVVIVNSALLLLVYFVAVGLTSLISKLIGKNFLDINLSKNRKTYWSDLDLKKKPIDEYYRQF